MHIDNRSNLSFQANKILTATKIARTGKQDVIDVFKLDFDKDRNFAERCYHILNKRKGSNVPKSLKDIFSMFLREKNYEMSDCYVAIKNGERISNVLYTYKNLGSESNIAFVENLANIINNQFTKSSMLMAFLNDVQKAGKCKPACGKSVNSLKPRAFVDYADIPNIRSVIKKANPNVIFKKFNSKKQYDLEEFLGIKDFETTNLLRIYS